MKINFNLNLKSKTKENTLIILVIRFNNKKLTFSTQQYTNPKNWDYSKQRVKTQAKNSIVINRNLEKYLEEIKDLYFNHYNKNPNQELIDLRNIKETKVDQEISYTFIETFDKYLDYLKNHKSEGIYKKLRTLKVKLINFSENKNIEMKFSLIDQNFVDEFIKYLVQNDKNGNNTINKYIDNLKMFLTWSKKRGLHNNIDYIDIEKVKSFSNEILFLTEEELNKIEHIDLSNNKQLDKCKDLFLFGCYTGQRFSDYSSFDYTEVTSSFWVKNQKKSGGKTIVKIPLSSKALNILNKYNQDSFPKISSQKFNKNIKKIAFLSEIYEPCKIVNVIGNKRIEEVKPKYELISSHTARKTFITLSLQKGMSTEAIKKISGHTSDSEFKKYLNIQDNWVKNEFTKAWG